MIHFGNIQSLPGCVSGLVDFSGKNANCIMYHIELGARVDVQAFLRKLQIDRQVGGPLMK